MLLEKNYRKYFFLIQKQREMWRRIPLLFAFLIRNLPSQSSQHKAPSLTCQETLSKLNAYRPLKDNLSQ